MRIIGVMMADIKKARVGFTSYLRPQGKTPIKLFESYKTYRNSGCDFFLEFPSGALIGVSLRDLFDGTDEKYLCE